MSVAVFISRAEKWMGEGREGDSSEVRFTFTFSNLADTFIQSDLQLGNI